VIGPPRYRLRPPPSDDPEAVLPYTGSLLPRHFFGAIEVYACWDSDQEAPPENHRILTPSSLETDDFYFRHKELSTLSEESG
jgi:hypothetical protein